MYAGKLESLIQAQTATTTDAQAKAEASDQAKGDMITTVTRAIEEIRGCLQAVSAKCTDASVSSGRIVEAANDAVEKAGEMSEAAASIITASGKVSGVAGRSRLLALNAKIEAACAGESGAGFGVVADEVKELSQESNASSGEISRIAAHIERGFRGMTQVIDVIAFASDQTLKNSDELVRAAEDQEQALQDLLGKLSEHAGDVDLF